MESLPTTTLSIRGEVELDLPEIRSITTRAFGQPDEADLIDRLRADGDIIKSLVALQAGIVIGHAMFSRLTIERDGEIITAAALGPMAVAPDRQGEGIGSLLIMRGLASMRRQKLAAVIVLGHPGYYPRFGFSAELAAALDAPYSGEAFMALELEEGALAGGGTVRYPAAFAAAS